jgi:CubicO group peptidase (beta-lactamase class C family)
MGESRALTWKPVLDQVLKEPLSNSSPQVLYSDLGFLLLGLWLERRWNQTLSEQFQNWKVARGLDANSGLTFGIPPQDPRYLLVEPTELRHAKGEVNDDKAASLGGIAPHAGLFGTLKDVTDWCEAVLRWSFEESKVAQWLSPGARIFDGGPRGRFYGGWDRPSPIPDSQGGFPCPERTLGHLGWTGTAFWWQPALKRVAVLLTNRVCPSHTAEGQAEMKKIRIAFFSDCWAGKLSSLWVPPL